MPRRDSPLTIRFSAEERAQIDRAAFNSDRKSSDWARLELLRATARGLAKDTQATLERPKFKPDPKGGSQ